MDPEGWSPHATYAATKMFVSQLNARQTQRFLNLILLNKVRDDVREHKRLHFALFQALKKAVFKPGAFYKGVVLPLLKCGDCTLREAVIISSVISRVSIPVDHSAAVRCPALDLPVADGVQRAQGAGACAHSSCCPQTLAVRGCRLCSRWRKCRTLA